MTAFNKSEFLADNADLSYKSSLMTNKDERVFRCDKAAVVACAARHTGPLKK